MLLRRISPPSEPEPESESSVSDLLLLFFFLCFLSSFFRRDRCNQNTAVAPLRTATSKKNRNRAY